MVCAVMATALWSLAAVLGFYAWDSLRETVTTALGQLTLAQIGASLFFLVGAIVAGVFGIAVWDDRDERNKNW